MKIRSIALLCAVAGSAVPQHAGAATHVPTVSNADLACLSRAAVETIRRHPRAVREAFRTCAPELRRVLGRAGLPTDPTTLTGAFAVAAAHRYAPYGPSIALTYRELRREPELDCDNYAYLARYLYGDLGGERRHFVIHGFDGGTLGNHAQIWVGDVMMDPTTGVLADLRHDDALRGASAKSVLDVSVRDAVPGYRDRVLGALREGRYRDSEILYERHFGWLDRRLAKLDLTRHDDRRLR